jgi:hypothetical protein
MVTGAEVASHNVKAWFDISIPNSVAYVVYFKDKIDIHPNIFSQEQHFLEGKKNLGLSQLSKISAKKKKNLGFTMPNIASI